MTENHDRIERTLEVLLYAPLGFGLFLKDTAPTFINMFISRGRAEVDRRHDEVQQHVTTARSLGEVTMAYGPPIVRERVSRTVADARRRAEAFLGTAAPGTVPTGAEAEAAPDPAPPGAEPEPASRPAASVPPVSPPTVPSPVPTMSPGDTVITPAAPEPPSGAPWSPESTSNGDPARSAGLPIPGYDALSASQVVERLVGLAPEELDAVHEYEASHRRRRTILGKIEQLAG
jgi:hypothetical protein